MENKEWLESLKPGDEVTLEGRFNLSIVKVKRLTKTQIFLENGMKYKIDTRRRIGGNIWDYSSIYPVTEEIKLRIKIGNMKHRISKIDFEKLPVSKIERILAIVSEEENGK